MLRTLEDDFKKVVGISWYLWLFVVLFLLLNIHAVLFGLPILSNPSCLPNLPSLGMWMAHLLLALFPAACCKSQLLLAVGAKLEHIITKLAMELSEEMYPQNQNEVNRVKPSDEHFWFNKPGIILYLIQFILFQNSFEIGFGVIIQVLCSYSTLPLYAIVSQMGDMFKQSIFHENMQLTLHGWAAEHAKKRKEKFGFSSLLHFGKKKKGESEIQINVASRASGSSQEAQQSDPSEGVVSVRIESPQPRAP
ncbi:hypothetical protein ZIOFF_033093 [Zingiber officinale]|uniref:MLO-like protein n=1 Tax=Zingiber officinale TaxID=94328 RepID=A0A8J5LBW5_ZINOF|nr:hypothetical protein ZIOFF_033093 [Zingiber officinale]